MTASQHPIQNTAGRESVPHCDWRDFISTKPDTAESTIKALDKYFPHFVAVEVKDNEIQPQKCVNCGQQLTGFFGGWRWGIAHGVGECGNCGWPSHGHHFIKDESGEEIVTLRNFILQVHPDYVTRKDAESST